jgi:hypothetical protein
VGVGQRPDDGRLNPLVLGDGVGKAVRVERCDVAVIALAEGGRVRLGRRA